MLHLVRILETLRWNCQIQLLWIPMKRDIRESPPCDRRECMVSSLGVLALVLVSGWLFLWNLGDSSISGASDEVIYVRIVQGILNDGHIFPLYHGSAPSFEKPPLKMWLSAVFPFFLGQSNFSFRIFDGLLGIFAVLLTLVLAYRLFGALAGAVCAGFLVLAAPEWVLFQHSFRTVVLDGFLTALSLGMALAAWSAVERHSRGESMRVPTVVVSLLGSLAVLTKSVGGLVPVVCAACALWSVDPSWRRARALWPLVIPGCVLAIYVGVVALVGGYPALKVFIGVEIFDRVITGFAGHNTGDRWFYLRYVFRRGGLAPAYLLMVGLSASIAAATSNLRFRFLLPWLLLPVMAYSLSSSRVPWYVSPFVPFAAIITVFGTTWCIGQVKSAGVRCVLSIVAVILVVPPYGRAIERSMKYCANSVRRIEIDTLVEQLQEKYDNFVVVGNALSGRSRPIRGRFNVEGIYREMLKPRLVVARAAQEVRPNDKSVVFAKEGDLPLLPTGGSIIARLAPNSVRPHTLVVVAYSNR